jgi:ligand-binding sensor domain-containing protein/signal transduction histidine kinase
MYKWSSQYCLYGICSTVIVLLTILAAIPSRADLFTAPEQWRWVHFTTESGLPSTEINDLCETKSGKVWVSTSKGIAWYNGYYWQTIDTSLGLPAHSARTIFPLDRDSIIVLTDSVLYSGTTTGFRPLFLPEHGRPNILEAVSTSPDSLFLLLRDEPATRPTLYLYSHGRLAPFSQPDSIPSQKKTPERIRCLYTTKNTLWLNTSSGLYQRKNGKWRLIYPHSQYLSFISHIVEDNSGNVFFFVNNGDKRGFWHYKNGVVAYTGVGKMFIPLSTDTAPDGTVLVVYSNGIISLHKNDKWTVFTPSQTETIGIEFAQYRENGDLWLQTINRLSLYKSSSRRWEYYNYGYDNAQNHINEILRARDGTLWIATGYGLHVHRPGKPAEVINTINGTKLEGITGLGEDPEGNIWISSGGIFTGAFRWDGSAWKHFGTREGLGKGRIHKIRTDRNGRLWFLTLQAFSTEGGEGAYLYDKGTFTRWGTQQGLLNNRVYSFVEDKNGALWFGTLSGISRWYNGTWKHWEKGESGQGKVYALAIDSSGHIWYSRYRRGFGYIKNDSLHEVSLSANGNRYDAEIAVVDIQVDPQNRVWIATEGHGLFCYANGIISNLQLNMGLGSINLWPIIYSRNKLYIGTLGRGLNILSFDDEEQIPDPTVVFGKPIIDNTETILRWQAFSFWGQIPYGSVETRYRINKNTWSEWSKSSEINLVDLSPGSYILYVQTKGLFATHSTTHSMAFTVPTPLHRSPFFALPVGLLIAAAVWMGGVAVVRKRNFNKELRRLNSELEYKIQERTVALVETNTKLQEEITQRTQAEEDLKKALLKEKELHELKSRFVTMVSHEFRTPLSVILASADLLNRYSDRLSPAEKQKYHQRIQNAVEHFTRLMDDVLFIGKVSSGQLGFHPTELNLESFCKDLATETEGQSQRISYRYEGSREKVQQATAAHYQQPAFQCTEIFLSRYGSPVLCKRYRYRCYVYGQ